MGRRLGDRALVGTRVLFAAVALAVLAPIPAHADIWCDIFSLGCGGGGTTARSNTERDAPEIDPGALANAIALAVGGAAIVRDRGRRRR
jgi:hypothetical protein